MLCCRLHYYYFFFQKILLETLSEWLTVSFQIESKLFARVISRQGKLPLIIRAQLSRNIVGIMSLLGIIVNHVISKLQTTFAVHPCSLISKFPIHDLQI